MPKTSIGLPAAIQDYLVTYGTRESAAQRALRALTDQQPAALMCSSTEQMQLLGLLCKLLGAARVIEVGVFTGYGTLALATALPPHGRVVAFDISEQYPALGRPYWEHAGVAAKIELRIGPAQEELRQLLQETKPEHFDLAYIDADKVSYEVYYEVCLQLVRRGGLIALDNVLWGGRVVDAAANDPDTRALKALNAKIARDERVEMVMVPIGDGVTLAMKK
jgi:predicted O-methyltransferase YrrM